MASEPSHLLSVEEADQYFRQEIEPLLLRKGQPQQQPTVVVLSAQPGAGKSTFAELLVERFGDAGAVRVDVDLFKMLHPAWQAVADVAPDHLVQADARRWFEQALDSLSSRRVNVVAEHGLRNREVFDNLLNRFSGTGYRIEVALLATPAAKSRLWILNRYQIVHEKGGIGRTIPNELHDERYEHLLQVADWLDSDRRISAVAVHRQGGGPPIFRNDRSSDGLWQDPASTRDALTAERERPWTEEESRSFLTLHSSLTARMDSRWVDQLTDARTSAQPHLHNAATLDQPTHGRTAITWGRYQLVSIAHLDTVRTILQDWPTVVVGVLDLDARTEPTASVPSHLQDYQRTAAANTAPERNPMTVSERVSFWRAAIEHAGLSDQVTVEAIPRPGLDPEGFNRRFPPNSFDVVFPAGAGSELSHQDRTELLGRPVQTVEPPLEFHTSDIRRSYQAGTDTWKRAFAPGALEPFVAANGPERLLTIEGKPDSLVKNLAAAQEHIAEAEASLDSTPAQQQPPREREPEPPTSPPGRSEPDLGL